MQWLKGHWLGSDPCGDSVVRLWCDVQPDDVRELVSNSKIFLTWVPMNSKLFLCNLICNSILSYFNILQSSFLGSVICNSSGSRIITVKWCGRLGTPHSFKNETDESFFVGIDNVLSMFGLYSWRCHKSQEWYENIDSFNLIGWFSCGSHPKKICPATLPFALDKHRQDASK